MCGIVGTIGKEPGASRVIAGLRRLEYRGYDSAGIASLEGGRITRVRAEGKLDNLIEKLKTQALSGTAVIGHTRWATHGIPNEANAHPHMTERLALVHNGTVENFRELRDELIRDGVAFESATDTEVVAQLLSVAVGNAKPEAMEKHPERVVYKVLKRLRGAYALLIIFDGHDDLMIAARQGMPVAIGYGKDEMFVGSDALALAPFTNQVQYLKDGDIAVVRRAGATLFCDDHGDSLVPRRINTGRPIQTIDVSEMVIDQGGYPHFMLKEIFEQPEVVGKTLAKYIDFASGQITLPESFKRIDFSRLGQLNMLACGTSYHAGLAAEVWFGEYADMIASAKIASEFIYRIQPLPANDASVIISQSGETKDTIGAMKLVQSAGQKAIAIVNVESSSIAREADATLPIKAGPEVSVASTKAFTCQLAALALLVITAGRARGTFSESDEQKFIAELEQVPGVLSQLFKLEEDIISAADLISDAKHALYLGRGISHALALEGALKLTEISYIHAQGYPAGEMKHGPISLITSEMPVIVIAPHDALFEKTMSNMQEALARGGKVVLFTDEHGTEATEGMPVMATIVLPKMPGLAVPFAYAMALQLLAYHTAVKLGREIDKPRNLAKSVTVE